jgi:hypothetical protein
VVLLSPEERWAATLAEATAVGVAVPYNFEQSSMNAFWLQTAVASLVRLDRPYNPHIAPHHPAAELRLLFSACAPTSRYEPAVAQSNPSQNTEENPQSRAIHCGISY